MAFPFLTEAGFEDGTRGHFDVETDTQSKLSFMHFSDMAGIPNMPAPWQGAFAMVVDLQPGTADAFVTESASWATAASGVIHHRFMFYASSDLVMANTNEFAIFQLRSAGAVVEAQISVNFTTANGFRLGVGEGAATQFLPLTLGKWHCVELQTTVDSGVGNDGTLIMRLDGAAATTVTALDQAAIADGVVGVVGQDAGTTRGRLVFDSIIADDARIFPPTIRWPESVILTASGHVFVGRGEIAQFYLLSGGATDNVATIYDTDMGNTNDATRIVAELKNTANAQTVASAFTPFKVQRGCYVSLTGTNPRALVQVCKPSAWGSDGSVRSYGAQRMPAPQNV